jgi:hypothetical protein
VKKSGSKLPHSKAEHQPGELNLLRVVKKSYRLQGTALFIQ